MVIIIKLTKRFKRFKSIYCPLTSFPYKSNIIVSYTNKCKLYKNTYKVSDVILYTNEINWKRTLLNAERVSQRPRSKKKSYLAC